MMSDRDERIFQKLESAGIATQRGLKKIKAREYAMTETYLKLALAKIQEAMKILRGEL